MQLLSANLEGRGRSVRRLGVVLLIKISLDRAIKISLMTAQIEQSLFGLLSCILPLYFTEISLTEV